MITIEITITESFVIREIVGMGVGEGIYIVGAGEIVGGSSFRGKHGTSIILPDPGAGKQSGIY